MQLRGRDPGRWGGFTGVPHASHCGWLWPGVGPWPGWEGNRLGQGNAAILPRAGGLHGPTPAPGMGQSSGGALLSFHRPELRDALPGALGAQGHPACTPQELGDVLPSKSRILCL